ncbi:MAG: hypothetical protein ABIS67_03165 [Candidatus Eisenbacteria bacterium]
MSDRKPVRKETRAPRAPFTLTTGWAAAILALLTVLFFHEVFLGGKTFVSPDTTAPAGFVAVGEVSLWKDKVYPLWNPFVFLGMPSFGSGAYNPLIYPPDWPLALVQKVVPLPDMTWLLLYYFLGGLFFFLLAREWGARPEAALIASAAFVFAPNLVAVGSHGHGSQLVDSAYLPLMLWLASRWLKRGELKDLGWLALAGGFQILRGHVQICFYTWLAVALVTAIDLIAGIRQPGALRARVVRAAGIGLAAALAFGIAGFYSLPLRDYARWSIRGGSEGGGVGMAYATQWSLAPYELPTMVFPGWTGFGGQTYWGGMPFTDYPNAFIGMVAVLLAVPAFLKRGQVPGGVRVFALALVAMSIFIAFGKNSPLYGFLYDHLPLFNKFRVPVMVLLLLQLAAGLGLAWGWTAVLDAGSGRSGKVARGADPNAGLARFVLIAAVLMGAGLIAAAAGGAFRDGYVRMAMEKHQPYSPDLGAVAYQAFTGDLARGCLLGLLALGIAWLAMRRTLTPALASIAILALVLIELMPVSYRVMSTVIGERVARNSDTGRDDVIDFLQKAGPPGSFRILPLAEMQNNRFAGFSIASLGGSHAAKPRLFQDLQDAQLQTSFPWMRLLNVRFIVAPEPLEVPPYLREAFRGSQVVYENLLVLPRVTLVDRYRVVTPAKAILDSVGQGTSESAEVAFLSEDPGMPMGTMGRARASIVGYRLNDVTVETESDGPAILRLADLWYPDWKAAVDGRPGRMLQTDYFLRGVVVPGGKHRVVFTFQSAAMRQGLTLSIVCLVLAVAAIAAGSFRRRPPAAAMEAA